MTALKVIVPKLNKRLAPVQDTKNRSNIAGLVLKDNIIQGELAQTNNLGNWYKDNEGYFYWGGGLISEHHDINFWVRHFGLNKISDLGSSISVAILDSGIDITHPDFSPNSIITKNFINETDDTNDYDGHGTFCAGILAGNGTKRIAGVIPGCNLLIGKVYYKSNYSPKTAWLKEGLKWAIKEADIISVSIGIADIEWDNEFIEIIDRAVENNKIIICAIGNKGDRLNENGNYPAKYKNCISVGALDNNFELSNLTKRFPNIDICLPGEYITSTYISTDGYLTDSGTSFSTPLLAGILALYKSKYKDLNLIAARQIINEISETKNIGTFKYLSIKNQSIIL